ncbi:MAG: peroxiredoxin family protein [Candidatus Zixiibacteriota bacterium]
MKKFHRLSLAFLLFSTPISAPCGETGAPASIQPSHARERRPSGHSLEAGDRAPEFSLPSLGGKTDTLSSHREDMVLLWFTNLCGGCQAALPEVQSLGRRYAPKDVSIMAVSLLGGDTATVSRIAGQHRVTFPMLIDPRGKVYEQYGGVKVHPGTCPANPQFFIVDKGLIAYATHFPGAPIDEIRNKVDSLIRARIPDSPRDSG